MQEHQVDWAIVFATFAGPLFAVLITLWHQRRAAERQARREIYVQMMRRRRHIMSSEFVGALNLVPVYFHQTKAVMNKYRELLKLLNDAGWDNPESALRMSEQVRSAVAYLLSAMSKAVGTPIDQLDILTEAYAPQRWADEELAQFQLRQALEGILSGQRPLAVRLIGQNDLDQ